MNYNKREYNKVNEKKVLHKVKKQWVVVSMALLGMLGIGAVHAEAHADTTKPQVDPNQDVKATVQHQKQAYSLTNSGQQNAENQQNNKNINQQSAPQPTTKQITDQAHQMTANLMANEAMKQTDNGRVDSNNRQPSVANSNDTKQQAEVAGKTTGRVTVEKASKPNDLERMTKNEGQITNGTNEPSVKSQKNGLDLATLGQEGDQPVNKIRKNKATASPFLNLDQVGNQNLNVQWTQSDWSGNGLTGHPASDGNGNSWTVLSGQYTGGTLSGLSGNVAFGNENGSKVTSNVTNMSDMFYSDKDLTSLNLSGLDTSNVTNMGFIFQNDINLTSLDLSGLDTSNVRYMDNMFYNDTGLTSLNLSGLDTSNLSDMDNMFYNDTGLTSLNLSGLDTSNVRELSNVFRSDTGLTSLNLSGLDTSNVTNMGFIFQNDINLTSLDLSGLDTSKVTSMDSMFLNDTSLTSLNLSGLTGNLNLAQNNYGFLGTSFQSNAYDKNGQNQGNSTMARSPTSAPNGLWFANQPGNQSTKYFSFKDVSDDPSDNVYHKYVKSDGTGSDNPTNTPYTAPNIDGPTSVVSPLNDVTNGVHPNIPNGFMFDPRDPGPHNDDNKVTFHIIRIPVHMTVNYQYNGNTVGSNTVTARDGRSEHHYSDGVPLGYQDNGKGSSDFTVRRNGTHNIDVEPATYQNTLRYIYDGKQVGTGIVSGLYNNHAHVSGSNLPQYNQLDENGHVTKKSYQLASANPTVTIGAPGTSHDIDVTPTNGYVDPMNPVASDNNGNDTLNVYPDYIITGYKWGNANVTLNTHTNTITVDGGKDKAMVGKNDNNLDQSFFYDIIKTTDANSGSNKDPQYSSGSGTKMTSLPIGQGSNQWTVNLKNVTLPNDSTDLLGDGVGIGSYQQNIKAINVSANQGVKASDVTYMSSMFENDTDLTSLNLSGLNTNDVKYMDGMFENDTDLTSLNLSGLNTNDVKNMNGMFDGDTSLTSLNLSGFNINGNDVFALDANLSRIKLDEMTGTLNIGDFYKTPFDGSKNIFDKNGHELSGQNNGSQDLEDMCSNPSGAAPDGEYYAPKETKFGTTYFFDDNSDASDSHRNKIVGSDKNADNVTIDGIPKADETHNGPISGIGVNGQTTDGFDGYHGPLSAATVTINSGNIPQGYYLDPNNKIRSESNGDVTLNVLPDYIITGYKWGNANVTLNTHTNTITVDGGKDKAMVGKGDGDHDQSLYDDIYKTTAANSGSNQDPQNGDGVNTLLSTLPTGNGKNWTVNVKNVTLPNNSKDLFSTLGVSSGHYDSDIGSINFIGHSNVDSSNANMNEMFYGDTSLTSLDLSGLDTSGVTNMEDMFYEDTSLTSLNLNGLNTSDVTNMESMFGNDTSLTSLNLSGLKTSSNLKSMTLMFMNDTSLTSLNLSGFNTSGVTNMNSVFAGDIDLSRIKLYTSNVNGGQIANLTGNGSANYSSMWISTPFQNGIYDSNGHQVGGNSFDGNEGVSSAIMADHGGKGAGNGEFYASTTQSVNNNVDYVDDTKHASAGISSDGLSDGHVLKSGSNKTVTETGVPLSARQHDGPISGVGPLGQTNDGFDGYHGPKPKIQIDTQNFSLPSGYYIDPVDPIRSNSNDTVKVNVLPDWLWSGYKWGQANVYIDTLHDKIIVDGKGTGANGQNGVVGKNDNNADQSIFNDVYKAVEQSQGSPNDSNGQNAQLTSLNNNDHDWGIVIKNAKAPRNADDLFSGDNGFTNDVESIDASGLDVSPSVDMKSAFRKDSDLQSLILSGWDTRNVNDMSNMFSSDDKLDQLTLGHDTNLKSGNDLEQAASDWYYMPNKSQVNLSQVSGPQAGLYERQDISVNYMFGTQSLGTGTVPVVPGSSNTTVPASKLAITFNGKHYTVDPRSRVAAHGLNVTIGSTPTVYLDQTGKVDHSTYYVTPSDTSASGYTMNGQDKQLPAKQLYVTGGSIGQNAEDAAQRYYIKHQVPAHIHSDGNTLYISDGVLSPSGRMDDSYNSDNSSDNVISNNGQKYQNITKIVFSDAVAPNNSSWLFGRFHNLESVSDTHVSGKNGLDTNHVTDLSSAFRSDDRLSNLAPLSHWDVSNVTNLSLVFHDDTSLSDLTPLSNWDVSNVTNLNSTLENVPRLSDLTPLSHWDVSNVTNLGFTFADDSHLRDLSPLSHWDVSNVTNLNYTFSSDFRLSDLNPIIDNWWFKHNPSNSGGSSNIFVSPDVFHTPDPVPSPYNQVGSDSNLFHNFGNGYSFNGQPNNYAIQKDYQNTHPRPYYYHRPTISISSYINNPHAVTSVLFSDVNAQYSISNFLSGLPDVTKVDANGLNTQGVSDMSDFFTGDNQIAHLRLNHDTNLDADNDLVNAPSDWYYVPTSTHVDLSNIKNPQAGWYANSHLAEHATIDYKYGSHDLGSVPLFFNPGKDSMTVPVSRLVYTKAGKQYAVDPRSRDASGVHISDGDTYTVDLDQTGKWGTSTWYQTPSDTSAADYNGVPSDQFYAVNGSLTSGSLRSDTNVAPSDVKRLAFNHVSLPADSSHLFDNLSNLSDLNADTLDMASANNENGMLSGDNALDQVYLDHNARFVDTGLINGADDWYRKTGHVQTDLAPVSNPVAGWYLRGGTKYTSTVEYSDNGRNEGNTTLTGYSDGPENGTLNLRPTIDRKPIGEPIGNHPQGLNSNYHVNNSNQFIPLNDHRATVPVTGNTKTDTINYRYNKQTISSSSITGNYGDKVTVTGTGLNPEYEVSNDGSQRFDLNGTAHDVAVNPRPAKITFMYGNHNLGTKNVPLNATDSDVPASRLTDTVDGKLYEVDPRNTIATNGKTLQSKQSDTIYVDQAGTWGSSKWYQTPSDTTNPAYAGAPSDQFYVDGGSLKNGSGDIAHNTDADTANIHQIAFHQVSLSTDAHQMFADLPHLTAFDGRNLTVDNAENVQGLFKDDPQLRNFAGLKAWNTSRFNDMSDMFASDPAISNSLVSDVKNWNVLNVDNLDNAFNDASIDWTPIKKTWKFTNKPSTNFMLKSSPRTPNTYQWTEQAGYLPPHDDNDYHFLQDVYSDTITYVYGGRKVGSGTYDSVSNQAPSDSTPGLSSDYAMDPRNMSPIKNVVDGKTKESHAYHNGANTVQVDLTGTDGNVRWYLTPDEQIRYIKSNYADNPVYGYVPAHELLLTPIKSTNGTLSDGNGYDNKADGTTGGELVKKIVSDLKTNPNTADKLTLNDLENGPTRDVRTIDIWPNVKLPANATGIFSGFHNVSEFNGRGLNTSQVTNLSHLFTNDWSLNSLNGLRNWNTVNATKLAGIFQNTRQHRGSLTNLTGISDWNTNKVSDLSNAFAGQQGLTDLSALRNWFKGHDGSVALKTLRGAFQSDPNLTDVSPIAGWNVHHVTDLSSLFQSDSRLSDWLPIYNDDGPHSNWYFTAANNHQPTDTDMLLNTALRAPYSDSGSHVQTPDLHYWNDSNVIHGWYFKDRDIYKIHVTVNLWDDVWTDNEASDGKSPKDWHWEDIGSIPHTLMLPSDHPGRPGSSIDVEHTISVNDLLPVGYVLEPNTKVQAYFSTNPDKVPTILYKDGKPFVAFNKAPRIKFMQGHPVIHLGDTIPPSFLVLNVMLGSGRPQRKSVIPNGSQNPPVSQTVHDVPHYITPSMPSLKSSSGRSVSVSSTFKAQVKAASSTVSSAASSTTSKSITSRLSSIADQLVARPKSTASQSQSHIASVVASSSSVAQDSVHGNHDSMRAHMKSTTPKVSMSQSNASSSQSNVSSTSIHYTSSASLGDWIDQLLDIDFNASATPKSSSSATAKSNVASVSHISRSSSVDTRLNPSQFSDRISQQDGSEDSEIGQLDSIVNDLDQEIADIRATEANDRHETKSASADVRQSIPVISKHRARWHGRHVRGRITRVQRAKAASHIQRGRHQMNRRYYVNLSKHGRYYAQTKRNVRIVRRHRHSFRYVRSLKSGARIRVVGIVRIGHRYYFKLSNSTYVTASKRAVRLDRDR